MNPSKIEKDLFNQNLQPPPRVHFPSQNSPFPLPEIDLYPSSSSSDPEIPNPNSPSQNPQFNFHVSPDPHISSQFYTFNKSSHTLMLNCLTKSRLPSPSEIRHATPPPILATWRSVWKDRNEDTAYLTAWKRIQDKLQTVPNGNHNTYLSFKNNSNQFVPFIEQWQHIVLTFHTNNNTNTNTTTTTTTNIANDNNNDKNQHLGLRDTIDRIKTMWTVGRKLYGIPESFIRTCLAACPVCNDESSGCAPRNKRRRFEYTESFEVSAKEVPVKLQQMATKHKVVLCIRQKYIRYKPFMAEVKDYACHRAGDPGGGKKRGRMAKREPYASKRCGCGFRIRAIVPILNYNEKDKTFVYDEEGVAVFKLYAVHSGHEPGALDGNARIMHRVVGHKVGFLMDYESLYGIAEEGDDYGFGLLGKDSDDLQRSVSQQLQELRNELGILEERIGKVPPEMLGSVSRDLYCIANKIRNVADDGSRSVGMFSEKQHLDDMLVVEHDLPDWGDDHHTQLYGDGKDADIIEDDEDSFGRTLGEVDSWDKMRLESSNDNDQSDLLGETCKDEKWLHCGHFDDKGIPEEVTKPLRHHDEVLDADVQGFYPESPKWFDSDRGANCVDGGFQDEEIV